MVLDLSSSELHGEHPENYNFEFKSLAQPNRSRISQLVGFNVDKFAGYWICLGVVSPNCRLVFGFGFYLALYVLYLF